MLFFSRKERGYAGDIEAINPRDVFLLYTRTKKTSSTLVASLIMETYARYGIPIANRAGRLEASVPGTFASVKHNFLKNDTVQTIQRVTG